MRPVLTDFAEKRLKTVIFSDFLAKTGKSGLVWGGFSARRPENTFLAPYLDPMAHFRGALYMHGSGPF